MMLTNVHSIFINRSRHDYQNNVKLRLSGEVPVDGSEAVQISASLYLLHALKPTFS